MSSCRKQNGQFTRCRPGGRGERGFNGAGLGGGPGQARFVWYTYDVWGNERDGFEVNDRSRRGTVTMHGNVREEGMLKALRDAGYLSKFATTRTVEIEGDDGEVWEFTERKNGRPIGQLFKED